MPPSTSPGSVLKGLSKHNLAYFQVRQVESKYLDEQKLTVRCMRGTDKVLKFIFGLSVFTPSHHIISFLCGCRYLGILSHCYLLMVDALISESTVARFPGIIRLTELPQLR
jgi:hypothetical protein